MSRKDELLKLARLFQAQSESCSRGPVKQSLRKLADYYQQEAERIRHQPVPPQRNKPDRAA